MTNFLAPSENAKTRVRSLVDRAGLTWLEPEWTGSAWNWEFVRPFRYLILPSQVEEGMVTEQVGDKLFWVRPGVKFQLLVGEELPLAMISMKPGPSAFFSWSPSIRDRSTPITEAWLLSAWRWAAGLDAEWVDPDGR